MNYRILIITLLNLILLSLAGPGWTSDPATPEVNQSGYQKNLKEWQAMSPSEKALLRE